MRRDNWERYFLATIEFAGSKPFEWGETDCCLFAAEVVYTITGKDYGAPFRGKYASASGAEEVLLDAGYSSIEELLDEKFKKLDTPLMAQRGDLVLLYPPNYDLPAVGVSLGDKAVFKAPTGLSYVYLSDCAGGWRV